MTQIEAIMALADEYADSCVGWHMVRNVETWHAREKTNAAKQQKDDDREALRAAIEQAAGKIAKGPNYPDGEENGPTIAAPDFELLAFARQIEAAHGIGTAQKGKQ